MLEVCLPVSRVEVTPKIYPPLFTAIFLLLLCAQGAMIKFVLMVNKMGQTRISSYYDWMPIPERVALEAEVVRRCFSRSELQCSFFEFRGYKIIYRRVSSIPDEQEFPDWGGMAVNTWQRCIKRFAVLKLFRLIGTYACQYRVQNG